MGYVYIGILVLLIIAIYSKEKKPTAPLFIFDAVWIFVFFCASINKQVTPAKPGTFFLMFAGVISLNVGGFLADYIHPIKIRIGRLAPGNTGGNYVFRKRIVFSLLYLCIIYYALNCLIVLKNAAGISFRHIMNAANSEDSLTTRFRIVNFLYTVVINPFCYVIPFITASDFWLGRRDKKILFLSVLTLLLRMFSSGNRMYFLFIFIFLIIVGIHTSCLKTKNIKQIYPRTEKRRLHSYIVAMVAVALVVFIFSTISRGYDVMTNVIINFAIPCRLFEIWAERVLESGDLGYGCASFQGIIYPIFYVLKNSVGLPMPEHIASVYDLTTQVVTEWVFGGTYMHNAYVSIFWCFYYDFREIGVIFLSCLIGFLSQRAYRRAIICPNLKSVSIYCAFTRLLVSSYSEMSFSTVGFGIGLLFLEFVLFRKVRFMGENNGCKK